MSVTRTDRWWGSRLRALPHAGALDDALVVLSRVQEHAAIWLALGLLGVACDRPRRREWARGALAVLATEAASQGVKRGVRRKRPAYDALPALAPTPSRYSLPSAHTASAVAAVVAYGPLAPRLPLRTAAVLTGLSRPYLGVHYPSDVLLGAVLGSAAARMLR